MGQIVSVPVLAELQGEIRRHPKTNKTFLVTAITSRSSLRASACGSRPTS